MNATAIEIITLTAEITAHWATPGITGPALADFPSWVFGSGCMELRLALVVGEVGVLGVSAVDLVGHGVKVKVTVSEFEDEGVLVQEHKLGGLRVGVQLGVIDVDPEGVPVVEVEAVELPLTEDVLVSVRELELEGVVDKEAVGLGVAVDVGVWEGETLADGVFELEALVVGLKDGVGVTDLEGELERVDVFDGVVDGVGVAAEVVDGLGVGVGSTSWKRRMGRASRPLTAHASLSHCWTPP
eukprot:gb/GECG01004438.1/.p1 GENE.gb/GECG01004438.1/~~gb/GECG01004438.1/.p1  ORF type:complete len:242 (+),score=20.35 gb/GECG01004438.1/:1-726(+)